MLASVAQLDVHPTGDQEVMDSTTPAGSFVEIDHEIFSAVILSSTDLRKAVVSFWQKNVHNTG